MVGEPFDCWWMDLEFDPSPNPKKPQVVVGTGIKITNLGGIVAGNINSGSISIPSVPTDKIQINFARAFGKSQAFRDLEKVVNGLAKSFKQVNQVLSPDKPFEVHAHSMTPKNNTVFDRKGHKRY